MFTFFIIYYEMNIDLKCINESGESTVFFILQKKRTCKPADSPDNDLWSKTRKYNTILRK